MSISDNGSSCSTAEEAPSPAGAVICEDESHQVTDTARLWACYAKAGAGDISENELVKAYLPLVKTLAGRLAMTLPPQVDSQDIYSAGLVGLLQAVRQFDPGAGVRFEAYARIRIRGAMLDELRRMDWAPRAVHVKARKVQEAIHELEQRYGRVPEDEEVASAMGLSTAAFKALLDEIRPATFISLDACTDEGSEDYSGPRHSAGEVLSDPNAVDACEAVSRAELGYLLAGRMQRLPELYRKILALYYFEGLRVNEIAAATGFSPAHICQSHTKAILALRAYVERYEQSGLGGPVRASADRAGKVVIS